MQLLVSHKEINLSILQTVKVIVFGHNPDQSIIKFTDLYSVESKSVPFLEHFGFGSLEDDVLRPFIRDMAIQKDLPYQMLYSQLAVDPSKDLIIAAMEYLSGSAFSIPFSVENFLYDPENGHKYLKPYNPNAIFKDYSASKLWFSNSSENASASTISEAVNYPSGLLIWDFSEQIPDLPQISTAQPTSYLSSPDLTTISDIFSTLSQTQSFDLTKPKYVTEATEFLTVAAQMFYDQVPFLRVAPHFHVNGALHIYPQGYAFSPVVSFENSAPGRIAKSLAAVIKSAASATGDSGPSELFPETSTEPRPLKDILESHFQELKTYPALGSAYNNGFDAVFTNHLPQQVYHSYVSKLFQNDTVSSSELLNCYWDFLRKAMTYNALPDAFIDIHGNLHKLLHDTEKLAINTHTALDDHHALLLKAAAENESNNNQGDSAPVSLYTAKVITESSFYS